MIKFEFDPEKFASAIAYLVMKKPGLTKKQICKLIYFADKQHLLTYGRTISGDVYRALQQGHVPSNGLNAINGDRRAGEFAIECVRRYGHLAGWEFVLDRDPDLSVLSKSDIRVLDDVIDRLGDLTAWQLERKSHNEPSWKGTPEKGKVDFELFFVGHPEANLIREILIEEQNTTNAPPQHAEIAD